MGLSEIYQAMGISPEVLSYGESILEELKERFEEIDNIAEYNQLKVIRAMQEAKVSEACLSGTTGYVIMIWAGILWRKYMPVFSARKML